MWGVTHIKLCRNQDSSRLTLVIPMIRDVSLPEQCDQPCVAVVSSRTPFSSTRSSMTPPPIQTELEELKEKRKELRITFVKTLNRIENKLEDQICKSESI